MRVVLDLLCLGPPRLTLGRKVLTLSPKAQALVCYLAVTGRPHSREELAGLLWSELPTSAIALSCLLTAEQLLWLSSSCAGLL